MKIMKFACALAFSLGVMGSVQAAPSTLSSCTASTLTTSQAGYLNCAGSFEGNLLNNFTEVTTAFGFTTESYFSSTNFANASNPFSQDEGANDDGTINFETAQTGKFVLGLKQGNAFSLYLFDGALVNGGITSIQYNTLGVYTPPVGGSKLSHAGFFGTPVTAVPEPESYALLLAGLGLMGTIIRRRRSK